MTNELVGMIKEVMFVFAMSFVRITACFTVIPFLNARSLGSAMIRNGFVAALAIFLYPTIVSQQPNTSPQLVELILLLLKESMIGMFIGFIATIPFWAMESAGFIIDNQRGASMANMNNAMTGSESSPMGIFFSQSFLAFFLSVGLFLMLLEIVLSSYVAWPIFSFYPKLGPEAMLFFMKQFDLIITVSVWLAAPAMICMFITEFGIALIGRSAPQLNVFILAMPIKSAVALMLLIAYFSIILEMSEKISLQLPKYIKELGATFL